MNRNASILALLLILGGAATGCVPVLRTRVVHYGVEGTLLEADTAQPVAKRRGYINVDGRGHLRKTDRSGAFRVNPERCRYFAWLMGGPFRMPPRGVVIEVVVDGCVACHREVVVWPVESFGLDPLRLAAGYVTLGGIEVKKSQSDRDVDGSVPSNTAVGRMSEAVDCSR